MPTDIRTILDLTVPVIVQIGERQVPVEDVLSLAPGSILELSKHADESLDLLINNKKIGLGEAVKVGENFGIRITAIGSTRDRIEALGDNAADSDAMLE